MPRCLLFWFLSYQEPSSDVLTKHITRFMPRPEKGLGEHRYRIRWMGHGDAGS